MQSSMFNVRVPLGSPDDATFLLNTFTDAQLIVGREVIDLLDSLDGRATAVPKALTDEQREAVATLQENGFIVDTRQAERGRLEQFFEEFRDSTSQLRVTVLTTIQCNFACDYCIQGDHGDYNRHATKMSIETAASVAAWVESRMDAVAPESFVLTLFGGEPLLNLPVAYYLAERLWTASSSRGIRMQINVITNGLLLTPEVVDRLLPYGLNGVKVTLDGDRDTHNRMRPLRGGQGTFDKIIANIRKIAGRCTISLGGNFDESSVESYPALLDFLAAQDFAPHLSRVNFKPIVSNVIESVQAGMDAPRPAAVGRKFIGLTPVSDGKPLNGTCMTSAGAGGAAQATACDTCHFASDGMAFLRDETRKRGFKTSDGVHMGPCEIHSRHAYTIGPEGDLYACPGFTGDRKMATGHITRDVHTPSTERLNTVAAWKNCGDCAFIPVCAGGCSVAAHSELGDVDRPSCHKRSFEAGVASLAREAAATLRAELVN